MIVTRSNIADYAREKGLELVQIDGIPEGFSFREPAITIGGVEHSGLYIAFIPLSDWQLVKTPQKDELLSLYKYARRHRYAQ